VENFRSCEHVYRIIVEQSLRYLTEWELEDLYAQGVFSETEVVNGSPSVGSWIDTAKFPFKVRIATFNNPCMLPRDGAEQDYNNRVCQTCTP
jgi:hypothetical protein